MKSINEYINAVINEDQYECEKEIYVGEYFNKNKDLLKKINSMGWEVSDYANNISKDFFITNEHMYKQLFVVRIGGFIQGSIPEFGITMRDGSKVYIFSSDEEYIEKIKKKIKNINKEQLIQIIVKNIADKNFNKTIETFSEKLYIEHNNDDKIQSIMLELNKLLLGI